MSRRLSVVLVPLVALLTLQGCVDMDLTGLDNAFGEGYGWGYCTGTAGTVSSVSVLASPMDYYTQLGDSVVLTSYVQDGACNPMSVSLTNAWSSTAPGVATVTPGAPAGQVAVVHTHAVGTAQVTLLLNGIAATQYVNVIPRIAELRMNPASATLKVGDSVFVSAAAVDVAGNVRTDILSYFFVNLDSGVVDSRYEMSGVWIFGKKIGTATVQAQLFERVSTSRITVVAP